jgi:hypothetical protein
MKKPEEIGHITSTEDVLAQMPNALGLIPVGSIVVAGVGCQDDCDGTNHRSVVQVAAEAVTEDPLASMSMVLTVSAEFGHRANLVAIHAVGPEESDTVSGGREDLCRMAAEVLPGYIPIWITANYLLGTYRTSDCAEDHPIPELVVQPGLTLVHGQQEFRRRFETDPYVLNFDDQQRAMEIVDELHGPRGKHLLVELLTDPRGMDDIRWATTPGKVREATCFWHVNGANLDSIIHTSVRSRNEDLKAGLALVAASKGYSHVSELILDKTAKGYDHRTHQKMAEVVRTLCASESGKYVLDPLDV